MHINTQWDFNITILFNIEKSLNRRPVALFLALMFAGSNPESNPKNYKKNDVILMINFLNLSVVSSICFLLHFRFNYGTPGTEPLNYYFRFGQLDLA